MEQDRTSADVSTAQEIRGQILVWLGIFGSILTISAHWAKFLKLAAWMRLIVDNFSYGVVWFWRQLGSIIHIVIPEDVAKALTFIVFWISLTIGSIIIAGTFRKVQSRALLILLMIPTVILTMGSYLIDSRIAYIYAYTNMADTALGQLLVLVSIGSVFFIAEGGILLRLTVSIMMFVVISTIWGLFGALTDMLAGYVRGFSGWPSPYIGISAFLLTLTIFVSLPVILAPTRSLAKRLSFVLIGVALIFALSQASMMFEKIQG